MTRYNNRLNIQCQMDDYSIYIRFSVNKTNGWFYVMEHTIHDVRTKSSVRKSFQWLTEDDRESQHYPKSKEAAQQLYDETLIECEELGMHLINVWEKGFAKL